MIRRCTVLLGAVFLPLGCASPTPPPTPSHPGAKPSHDGERQNETSTAPATTPPVLEQASAGMPDRIRCERDELSQVYCGLASEDERSLVPQLDGAVGLVAVQRVICANIEHQRVVCLAPNSGNVATVEGLFEPQFIYQQGHQVCAIGEGEVSCFDPERFVAVSDQPRDVPGHLKDRPFRTGPAASIDRLAPTRRTSYFLDHSGRLCKDASCSTIREEVPPLQDAALDSWEAGCGITWAHQVLCWRPAWHKDERGNPFLTTDVEVLDEIEGAQNVALVGVDLEQGARPPGCALTDRKEVWCFGDDDTGGSESDEFGEFGEFGDSRREPAQRVQLPPVSRLISIDGAICADLESGPRHCRGETFRLRPGSFEAWPGED